MDELKIIFASNLIKLRTAAGLTQAELGEKLHYSDKSVSKWERGESVPDAYVLKCMAELFGVSVDYLISSHDQWEKPQSPGEETESYSRLFITLACIAGIWTLTVAEFVVAWLLGYAHWIGFVAAVPVSLITWLVLNSIWFKGKHNMYIVGALVLCILALIYFVLLEYNFWQMFIIAIPAEVVVYLSFQIGNKRIKRKKKSK
ncbi:MAG: helix-turn-helix transcriptional regulator [Oscillospiraceae bacterium]|nr:helix-turn-helix transcriptional regulator [Oscillospiraceae bacterium]